MVVLALVLLVVGKCLVSMLVTRFGCRTVGGCFGYQFGTKYGVVFATFSQWRIFGYKYGTINAPLSNEFASSTYVRSARMMVDDGLIISLEINIIRAIIRTILI